MKIWCFLPLTVALKSYHNNSFVGCKPKHLKDAKMLFRAERSIKLGDKWVCHDEQPFS